MARLEDDLLLPENYPPPRPSSLVLVETPRSLVFLGDREAWKIRRPLLCGGLDCRSPAERERLCHEEVRLNRRLSAEVYRGVLPVRRDGAGHSFVREGEVVDFAVRMRRLPGDRSARALLAAGRLDAGQIEALARRMADFYGTAAKVPRPGAAGALRARLLEDLEELAAVPPALAPPGGTREIGAFLLRSLRRKAGTLARRAAGGRILEAHGDLRLDHVYLEEGAEAPTVVDAVDFHERFGGLDPAADAALLAADLEASGRGDLGERFLAALAAAAGDFGIYEVLDLYLCWRAAARAKNLAAEALHPCLGPEAAAARRAEAARLLAAAAGFARPREPGPVVAVGGVMGVGKTTLAAALSRRLRLPVVAEDGARRGLAGEGDPFSPAAGRRTCAEFLRRARAVLGSGRGVVLDGPFRTRASRGRARRLAERAGRGFLFVEVVCPAGVLRRRIRGHRPDSVGDLPERSWREFEAPGEVAAGERMRIESVEAPERMAAAVEERLRGGVEVGG